MPTKKHKPKACADSTQKTLFTDANAIVKSDTIAETKTALFTQGVPTRKTNAQTRKTKYMPRVVSLSELYDY